MRLHVAQYQTCHYLRVRIIMTGFPDGYRFQFVRQAFHDLHSTSLYRAITEMRRSVSGSQDPSEQNSEKTLLDSAPWPATPYQDRC